MPNQFASVLNRASNNALWLSILLALSCLVTAYWQASALFASMFFVCVGFSVAFASIQRQADWRYTVILLCAVVCYQLFAVINSYFWDLPGARPDSITFYEYGVLFARQQHFEFGVDYIFYVNWLGLLFRLFSPSYFLASQLSVIALIVSVVVFNRIAVYYQVKDQWRLLACILFAFFPGTVFVGVVPLREAFELLFLLMTVFFGVGLLVARQRMYFVAMLGAAVLLALIHKALLFYSVIICSIFSLGWLVQTRHQNRTRVLVISAIGVTLLSALIASLVYFNSSGRSLAYGLVDKNMWWSIWHYRYSVDNIGNPRSAYDLVFSYETHWAAITSLLNIFTHYMFYPMFPATLRPEDIYASFESWFRLGSLAYIAWGLKTKHVHSRVMVWALLAVYFSLTFMWSIGTTNYGQAIRHHMLSNWILILLLAVYVSSSRKQTVI